MNGPGHVDTFSFDVSTLVQRSVASLYSHLVTRPTGRALRLGIESQIGEIGAVCVSVLDFTQVVILDYSCADEAVAKLIQRYQADDRPADAYFVARLREQHRDPIDEVLMRQSLALVAEIEGEFTLLGNANNAERDAWTALQRARLARSAEIANELDAAEHDIERVLDGLAMRRVALRRSDTDSFYALSTLLPATDR